MKNQEIIGGVFQDLSNDLTVIVKLFDIITHSPEMITKELLDKTKAKVRSILTKVDNAKESLVNQTLKVNRTTSRKLELDSDKKQYPAQILEDIVKQYKDKLYTQTTLYNDEARKIKLDDRDFRYILTTLLESAKKTQNGILNKTCEVSIASKHNTMVMLFKDFGRKIPSDIVHKMFTGDTCTQDYGGGYPMYRLKRVLNSVGGDVDIDLSNSKFTTFIINVPFEE